MQEKRLVFPYLIGEGVGRDYDKALTQLLTGLGIDYQIERIENFRGPNQELDPTVLDVFRQFKFGLKGPTKTPPGNGPASVNVALRQGLDLFVNLRPVQWIPGVPSPIHDPQKVDMYIFRENSEDLYAGIEFGAGTDKAKQLAAFLSGELGVDERKLMNDPALGIKPITKEASARLMRFALDFMLKLNKRSRLTIGHKSNIMKLTDGMFLKACMDVARLEYKGKAWGADIGLEDIGELVEITSTIQDDLQQQILLHPEMYNGIVTPNYFGDLVSDLAAAMVGGATLAAGANIGDNFALFEGIGGTGDKIAGKGIANPTAHFKAVAMMLEYAGREEGRLINAGLAGVLGNGKGTFDIYPNNPMNTYEFTEAVIESAMSVV